MKDAIGRELKIGQKVASPCNSRFKIGVLYNIKDNNGKRYKEMCEYVASTALQEQDRRNNNGYLSWRQVWWTQERVDAQKHKFYVRYADEKTRTFVDGDCLIILPDDTQIQPYKKAE